MLIVARHSSELGISSVAQSSRIAEARWMNERWSAVRTRAVNRPPRRLRCAAALLVVVGVSCSSGSTPTGAGDAPPTSGAASTASIENEVEDPAGSGEVTTATDESGDSTLVMPVVAATDAPPSSIPMPVFDPGLLPSAPAPTVLVAADPAGRAIELLAATNSDQADVSPGWVAAYTEFGLPVIDPGGPPAGGDPVGPEWDSVWSIGALSRGSARVPLADLGPLFTFDDSAPVDPAALLADLRTAAASSDPNDQTFSLFVAGRARVQGGGDLLDPAVTVEQVSFDAATIQLVMWTVAREAFLASAAIDGPAAAQPNRFASSTIGASLGGPTVVRRRAGAEPCGGSTKSEEPSWVEWALGVIAGGVDVGGVFESSSVVDTVIEAVATVTVGAEKGAKLAAKASAIINRLNILATSVSLAAMINAIDIRAAIEPDLVRRPQAQDGYQANIAFQVYFNAGKLNGDSPILCALTKVANALGIGLALPADGKGLENVELLITSGTNFGTKVYFADDGNRKRTTDAEGFVRFDVQGKARKMALPDPSPTFLDEFGLEVSSQIEGINGDTITSVFVSGLSGIAKGGLPAALVIAKTFHYDLGEVILPFTDHVSGYLLTTNSFWDFPESQLSVGASFTDAKLLPDGAGGYTGTAVATWQTGSIGTAACGLTETPNDTSDVLLTGVVGPGGKLTVTATYADVGLHNVTSCYGYGGTDTVVALADPVVIAGDVGFVSAGSSPQVLSSGGQTNTGVVDFELVPVTND